jgi:ProP effector
LRSALWAYTSRAGYLRALTAGAPRVGIDGAPAGAMTPDEDTVAKARLAELAKRVAPAVIAAKAPPTPHTGPNTPALAPATEVAKATAPAPAEPKRLSLADLREAGRRRRR